MTLPDQLDFNQRSEVVSLDYGNDYGNEPSVGSLRSPLVSESSTTVVYPSRVSQFLHYEIGSHEAALADFESEVRFGKKPAVKAVAKQYEPLVRQNLLDLQAASNHAESGTDGNSA